MRTMIRSAAAGAFLLLAGGTAAAQTAVEGTWTATETAAEPMQLTLQWGTSTWGRRIDRAEMRGLTRQQIAASVSTPVAFRVEREAGVFEMEGAFREGRGAGHFRFRPDRRFAATLRTLGVHDADGVTDEQLMQLAVAGARAADVREFSRLGLAPLTLRDVIRLAIHGVTPEYVRSLRALGLAETGTAPEVVRMRIHRVTPEYVRSLEALGFRDLDTRDLLQMSIHRVRPEEVRELRALGYTDLSPRDAVQMRIHRATPDYIRDLAALGYRDLPPRQLVRLRIHRVTPEFIREVRAAGHRDATPNTLVRMRIHGVDSGPARGRERRRP